eukprot:TRINITY_DN14022_c0_g1_i3.p1 TRINITY_DN14022_c0_g1~~TRINITY_DN14022_c0_g1_i3.p1  ORF type:complete len:624 (+),score=171.52 TRINITY_DN14022_c0_g1_i3:92-1963(+)
MIRRPPRSTLSSSSAASDVYKRQVHMLRAKLLERATLLTADIARRVVDKFFGLLPLEFEHWYYADGFYSEYEDTDSVEVYRSKDELYVWQLLDAVQKQRLSFLDDSLPDKPASPSGDSSLDESTDNVDRLETLEEGDQEPAEHQQSFVHGKSSGILERTTSVELNNVCAEFGMLSLDDVLLLHAMAVKIQRCWRATQAARTCQRIVSSFERRALGSSLPDDCGRIPVHQMSPNGRDLRQSELDAVVISDLIPSMSKDLKSMFASYAFISGDRDVIDFETGLPRFLADAGLLEECTSLVQVALCQKGVDTLESLLFLLEREVPESPEVGRLTVGFAKAGVLCLNDLGRLDRNPEFLDSLEPSIQGVIAPCINHLVFLKRTAGAAYPAFWHFLEVLAEKMYGDPELDPTQAKLRYLDQDLQEDIDQEQLDLDLRIAESQAQPPISKGSQVSITGDLTHPSANAQLTAIQPSIARLLMEPDPRIVESTQQLCEDVHDLFQALQADPRDHADIVAKNQALDRAFRVLDGAIQFRNEREAGHHQNAGLGEDLRATVQTRVEYSSFRRTPMVSTRRALIEFKSAKNDLDDAYVRSQKAFRKKAAFDRSALEQRYTQACLLYTSPSPRDS